MSARNQGWNLLSELKTDNRGAGNDLHDNADQKDNADRWIWFVWVGVALVAVAILPFASRFQEVANAVAVFCGFTI